MKRQTTSSTREWPKLPLRETAVLLCGLAVSIAYRATVQPNHDATWFILIASELLDGASFYDRFIDPNWPVAAYAMMPAAWLWQRGLDVGTALSIETHATAAFSLSFCLLLLRRDGMAERARLGVLVALLLSTLWLPNQDFGQREHLFALLILPYLTLAGLRFDGKDVARSWAVAAGLAAGAAASIKPPFVLIPLAIEVLMLWRWRSLKAPLRPETLTLAAWVLCCTVVVLAAFPEYPAIARRLVRVYDGYRQPGALAVMAELSALILLPVGVAWRTGAVTGRLLCGGAAVSAALVVYWLQLKGWPYQALPAPIFATVLLAPVAVEGRTPARRVVATLAFGALTWVWNILSPTLPIRELTSYLDLLSSRPGAFYALSSSVRPFFPAGPMLRKPWGGRANCLFYLPGIVGAERQASRDGTPLPADIAELRDWLRRSVAKDLTRTRPTQVLILPAPSDTADPPQGLLAWFLEDPDFRQAWAPYRHAGQVQSSTVYTRDVP